MNIHFRAGQRAVLVDDSWSYLCFGVEIMPVLNSIYTIREVITLNGHVAVRLVEIKNPVLEYGDGTNEIAFRASRFRPVVERKSDISIFRAMLNHSKSKVSA